MRGIGITREIIIEAQLMQDWKPRTRPSEGKFILGDASPVMFVMYPGSVSFGEHIVCFMEGATRSDPGWCVARVSVSIDGVMLSSPRPIMFFLGESDIPSGIAHFPVMSDDRNPRYAGRHSLLMRTVWRHV